MIKDEQSESIKPHRENDAQFLRNNYLAVIKMHTDDEGNLRGTHQEIRNYLKACSDLAKLQHLLQREKDEDKPKKKESPFSDAETKKLNARLKETLGDTWTESSDNISEN